MQCCGHPVAGVVRRQSLPFRPSPVMPAVNEFLFGHEKLIMLVS